MESFLESKMRCARAQVRLAVGKLGRTILYSFFLGQICSSRERCNEVNPM